MQFNMILKSVDMYFSRKLLFDQKLMLLVGNIFFQLVIATQLDPKMVAYVTVIQISLWDLLLANVDASQI